MLKKIKNKIGENCDLNESRGLFFSLFDKDRVLLSSNGVLFTDRTLTEIVTKLYNGIIANQLNAKFIGIDIVKEISMETDPQTLKDINTKEKGIYIYSEKTDTSGVILPNTSKIDNIQTAIQLIKQKTDIGGQAQIYSFTTDRIIISI